MKILRTANLASNFTGSYKKRVYHNVPCFNKIFFQQNIMLGDSWLKLRRASKISSNRNYFSHFKKIYTEKINLYYYLLYIEQDISGLEPLYFRMKQFRYF